MMRSILLVTLAIPLAACVETRTCPEGTGFPPLPGGGRGDMCVPLPDAQVDGGRRDAGPDASACGVCSDETPLCRASDGECVECLGVADCGDTLFCDTEAGACVECMGAADCTNPSKPICTGGECTACTADPQCEALGTDRNLCEGGSCVACRSEDDCHGNVCDPASKTCTEVPARVRDVCQTCTFDAECMAGRLCIEMSYSDPTAEVVGRFCLWERTATELGAPNGTCGLASRPFAGSLVTESVDGAAADVCTLRTTTCPAYLQHATDVPGCDVAGVGDSACGAAGFNDGRCRGITETFCTYPCGGADDRDCPAGFTCTSGGDRYCSI